MPIWEYKVITSGKGGFATPALLEKFLNDLGREEWEIIEFHTQSDNFLAFTGLARRSTQRDWTLEDAAAAAAKAEADKLRAEFEAKFKSATNTAAGTTEEAAGAFLEEKLAPDDGLRKLVDTSHDADAEDDEKEEDDWDKLTAAEEDELPTFFDAIKPHMRRNQRGPGMSVGVDYLAKKWGQSEDDLKGALVECGFTVPDDEDAKPEYLEFEGDLYWVNVNRRGELWINTKEKPRPVFRAVKAQKVAVEEEQKPERQPKHERGERKQEGPKPESAGAEAAPAEGAESAAAPATEGHEQPAAAEGPAAPLPEGTALLEKIRPMMRRNRRGPGGSGSVSFLSRALKCRDSDLVAGFKALGLVIPSSPNEKPTNVEIANQVWWVNVDSRGGIWINGRDKKGGEVIESPAAQATSPTAPGETAAGAAPEGAPSAGTEAAPTPALTGESAAPVPFETQPASAAPEGVPAPEVAPAATTEPASGQSSAAPAVSAASAETLALVRPLLKETKTGSHAGKLERLAEDLSKPVEELVNQLVAAGLVVPDKSREKPVFVEHATEIFWLNRNPRGDLWLNAKASKSGDRSADEAGEGEAEGGAEGEAGGEKKPRRPRSRKKAD